MREIISKASGKRQIITEETWNEIISHGMERRFKMQTLPEKQLTPVPLINIEPPTITEIPIEVKTKTKNKN